MNINNVFEYFGTDYWVRKALEPLLVANAVDSVKTVCFVRGGGNTGQSDSIKLGVASCLFKVSPY